MACEQYFKTCRNCGRQILMTRNQQNGRWIPCEPEIFRFIPVNGAELYVTPEGMTVRGVRNHEGQFGYKRHSKGCETAR